MNDKLDIFLDTGANRSIINKEYANSLLPNVVIKDFDDILSDADKLQVRWGNQKILPSESFYHHGDDSKLYHCSSSQQE